MEQTPASIFREVKRLIGLNKLDEAKLILQPLVTEFRSDCRVFSLLGFIYHREGRFSRAIRNYKRALEINPGDVETAINLSLIYNELGRYEQGSELYAQAVDLLKNAKPDVDQNVLKDDEINVMFSGQHASIGELYLRYNKAQEALQEFEKALSLSPRSYNLYVDIAECLSRLGKRRSAIKKLGVFKNKKPEFFEARVKLGHLLFLEGEVGPAVEEWDSVLREDPDNMEARMYIKMAKDETILP